MTIDLLQVAGSLGVGAFLGLIIFFMYRLDRQASEKRFRDAWKAHTDRIAILAERDRETREENTKVLTELVTLLKIMNGRLSRGK
jgi:Flp pilus assembly protein TadB